MRHFFFLLASTFVMGIVSGAFVYFISKDHGSVFDFGRENNVEAFEITADAYGECQLSGTCVSYRISEDGSYIYLVSHRNRADERLSGDLSSGKLDDLKTALRSAPLATIVDSSRTGACSAHRFDVRISGVSYIVDTCKHDVGSEELFGLLEDFFDSLTEVR